MLVVFSLDQLKMIRSSLRMCIDLNHTVSSFKFNDMMDLYQIVCVYSGRNEESIDKYKSEETKSKKATLKLGKWNNHEHYICSACHHVVNFEPCYHFCPMCGVEWREVEE